MLILITTQLHIQPPVGTSCASIDKLQDFFYIDDGLQKKSLNLVLGNRETLQTYVFEYYIIKYDFGLSSTLSLVTF